MNESARRYVEDRNKAVKEIFLEQRRLSELNNDHRGPVFSSRRLFWMTVACFIGVVMVAYGLL